MTEIPLTTFVQMILGMLVTLGCPVFGWFIHKIFNELDLRRQNERELYQQVARLQIQICQDVCEVKELLYTKLERIGK